MRSDLKEQIKGFMARYPTRRSAIMPALCLAQEREGSLHGEILKDIADVLDVPEIWVYEITSFYSMFHSEPVGKFHIQLCTNVSCLLCRAGQLLEHLEQRLQIGAGDTTPDGLFTLSTVECLGSCDTAPVFMVNEQYHENMSEDRIDELLDNLTRQSAE
jgi:NADH-quinone oxidoreductase subunit E